MICFCKQIPEFMLFLSNISEENFANCLGFQNVILKKDIVL